MNKEDGVMVGKKAEIDTRPPFRSVKEAVSLFGEKVLAQELYATQLKEIQSNGGNEYGVQVEEENSRRLGKVAVELEETRQNLERAREESMLMAHCLSSLQEELERTKQELQHLKHRDNKKKNKNNNAYDNNGSPGMESENEDLKFIENVTKLEIKEEERMEFQKKRYVTFANPPTVAHVILPQGVEKLERHPSLRKKKKIPLIPLIGGIFSRKKQNHPQV